MPLKAVIYACNVMITSHICSCFLVISYLILPKLAPLCAFKKALGKMLKQGLRRGDGEKEQ